MSDIVILVESKGGALEKMTLELIRGAGDLAKELGTGISAVVATLPRLVLRIRG